ncbi:MAG: GNAT family N-acetyltransferase [Candidatus Promineifilaceae bacterium]
MMTLAEQRRAIRPLLHENDPVDALSAYYAYYHDDKKTHLVLFPPESRQAAGYLCFSRTGIDLFRPLVTMRLPADPAKVSELFYSAMPEGTDVFIQAPAIYLPILGALFEIQKEEYLKLYHLKSGRFKPIINVLVTRQDTPDGQVGFVIRESSQDVPRSESQVVASAWLNWQSPRFAEISVRTQSAYRRRGLGRSVVSATAQYILENGRTPLYVVAEQNEASIQLAESLGFTDTGARDVILEARLRPKVY